MATTLGVSLAWLALLMAQGGAPRRPKPAAFDTVLAGTLPAGRVVDFPAVLLPPTAIQTTTGGKARYFVLAVRKDSVYFLGLAEAAQSLREQAPEKLAELAASTRDDKKYQAVMSELGAILDAAVGVKISRLALVDPGEVVAVEVTGLEKLGSAYNWETVVDTNPSAARLTPVPLTSSPAVPSLPGSRRDWDEVGTRLALVNLAQSQPPDLTRKLPEFTTEKPFTDARHLESYNVAVELFNAELVRRREHALQRTQEEVKLALQRLERFLAMEEQTLQATVIAKADLAVQTFGRIYGRAPAAFVRERAKPDAAFASRAFRTAGLFLTSYPSGATVTIDGRAAGVTPLSLPELPVGTSVALIVAYGGFRTKEMRETVAPQSSGVKRIDLNLEPEGGPAVRPMTSDEAKRLFASGFTPPKKFTLAVLAASERRGFAGKKDKDGTKRAEAMRKAAAVPAGTSYGGWFDQSANPDVAEVTLEISQPEAAEAKDPKNDRVFRFTYRGAQQEESVREVMSLNDDRAGTDRLLLRIMEQLKHRQWLRALGGS
jgi:hypothetical protein